MNSNAFVIFVAHQSSSKLPIIIEEPPKSALTNCKRKHGKVLVTAKPGKPTKKQRRNPSTNPIINLRQQMTSKPKPTRTPMANRMSKPRATAMRKPQPSPSRRIMFISFTPNGAISKSGYAEQKTVESELRGKFAVYSTDRLSKPCLFPADEIRLPHCKDPSLIAATSRVVLVPSNAFRYKTVLELKVDDYLIYHCYYDKKTQMVQIFELNKLKPAQQAPVLMHAPYGFAIRVIKKTHQVKKRKLYYSFKAQCFAIAEEESFVITRKEKTMRKENAFE